MRNDARPRPTLRSLNGPKACVDLLTVNEASLCIRTYSLAASSDVNSHRAAVERLHFQSLFQNLDPSRGMALESLSRTCASTSVFYYTMFEMYN